MGILSEAVNAIGGGLAKEVFDTVKAYFPPSMSDEDKAKLQMSLQQLEDKRQAQADSAATQAEQDLNARIKDYEGTASDLKSVPVLGALMLFLRGAFRPLFSYFVAFMDFEVFSGAWALPDEQQRSAFWIINFLVLGFFFGERAIKNVMPAVAQMMAARAKP